MHLEAWISVVSVASFPVTLGAAGVAVWQAKAAKDQVREARRSATAAEEQVEMMRRQHEEYQAEQAAFVTIEVGYSTSVYGDNSDLRSVTITNHSNQPVHRPQIESMGDVRPPARWGWDQLCLVDEEGDEYVLGTDGMLLPHAFTRVPYQQGRLDPHIDNFFNDKVKYVQVDDVTITFGMSGARWQRTGNRQPVRVVG
jgi:hypothetical protein